MYGILHLEVIHYRRGENVMKLSARNQFKGTVLEVKEGAVSAVVIVDIGGGNKVTSTISLDSVKELGIKVGSEVTTIIKSTSVMLGV